MENFKLSVYKGQKKYSIVVSANSELEAKDILHKEGYSILGIEKIDIEKIEGIRFSFEIRDPKGTKIQKGYVIGKDIFKIYLKLRKELGYDVLKLLHESDENKNEEDKRKILHALEEQYYLYETTIAEKKEKEESPEVNFKDTAEIGDSFHMKKELEEVHKMIDYILLKIRNLIDNVEDYQLEDTVKQRLMDIYNNIIKIKNTTNISKLKQIGELALMKIGEIELKNVEKKKTKEARDLLTDTNKLLKKIGSTSQVVEKERDIHFIMNKFLNKGEEKLSSILGDFSKKKQESDISYSYLKTLILLKKYTNKLKENNKELVENIVVFIIPSEKNRERKDKILLKRKVIQQNISILEVRKSGKKYSYTLIKQGYTKIFSWLLSVLAPIKNYVLGIVILYAIFFLFTISFSFLGFIEYNLNYKGIYYFLYVLSLFFMIYVYRGFFSLFLNIVFLYFIFIFGVVNF